MMEQLSSIEAVFIGTSAGGVAALNKIFRSLPAHFKLPIIVVLHLGDNQLIPSAFHAPTGVQVKEAEEKDLVEPNHIYFAPAGYHLLIENDFTFSLTTEEKVQYARPSLDVTMDSLARVYEEKLLGIVLTGANEDGAEGLSIIKKFGGMTIVQNPEDADHDTMPIAAIKKSEPDFIFTLNEIESLLRKLEGHHE